jgi:glycosyltransferase involved in cell wall biosynthesis
MIKESRPDALHIAVEGPLGWLARYYANSHNIKFTTSYHTCVPEYLKIYFGIPLSWGYSLLRYFHAPAIRTMVTTQSMKERLASKGFKHISIWSRGVDLKTFNPHPSTLPPLNLPLKTHPIFLYVGRIAPEKNIEAFLDLNLPGIKCVVGDGPYLALLKNKYRATNIYWVGKIQSRFELAHFYATADVFVFPSKTDTFGNVLLEAMACSLPVAAYPVTGPLDIIENASIGALDEDLRKACLKALTIDRKAVRTFAEKFTWKKTTEQFIGSLHIVANK